MLLLNCLHCDDIVKLVENERRCECGHARGSLSMDPTPSVHGPARVLEITWEAYDGLAEGETRPITVLPRSKTKWRPL
jgi:hypothetical protein